MLRHTKASDISAGESAVRYAPIPRQSGRSDTGVCHDCISGGLRSSTSGGPSSNQAASLESQQIHQIQSACDGIIHWIDCGCACTLFGSLKIERLHGMQFATRRQAKDDIINWLQFYNHRRLHSTLGYLSPMASRKIGLPI